MACAHTKMIIEQTLTKFPSVLSSQNCLATNMISANSISMRHHLKSQVFAHIKMTTELKKWKFNFARNYSKSHVTMSITASLTIMSSHQLRPECVHIWKNLWGIRKLFQHVSHMLKTCKLAKIQQNVISILMKLHRPNQISAPTRTNTELWNISLKDARDCHFHFARHMTSARLILKSRRAMNLASALIWMR